MQENETNNIWPVKELRKSDELESAALKAENISLKLENESLQAEIQTITSAADRNSVKMGKITRQNATYIERIKELEDELGGLKEVNDESSSISDGSQFLITSEYVNNRKRTSSDGGSDQLIETKKTPKLSITSMMSTEDISSYLIHTIKMSFFLKFTNFNFTFNILHTCECWIIVQTTRPLKNENKCEERNFLFRKLISSPHEKHCQAAVKGNLSWDIKGMLYKLKNCKGEEFIQKATVKDSDFSQMKWFKMFQQHRCPELNEVNLQVVEYFAEDLIGRVPRINSVWGLNGYRLLPIDEKYSNEKFDLYTTTLSRFISPTTCPDIINISIQEADMSQFVSNDQDQNHVVKTKHNGTYVNERSLIVFHSCTCWLIFGVFRSQRRVSGLNKPLKWYNNVNRSYAVRRKACEMKDQCTIVHETKMKVWEKTENLRFDHFFQVTNCQDQTFTCYHIRTTPLQYGFNSDLETSIAYIQAFENPLKAFQFLKNPEEFIHLPYLTLQKLASQSVDNKEPSDVNSVTANVSDSDSVKATVDSDSK